jgi:hypothetical protein
MSYELLMMNCRWDEILGFEGSQQLNNITI